MKTEIEAKFLSVDHDAMRDTLRAIDATLIAPMRLMRRVLIHTDHMDSKDAFVRIRDEGNKVTVTYKQFDERSLHGAKEIEITVNDFDDAIALLAAAGLPHDSFQESKRETWQVPGGEVVLDEWPWLDPMIEIEGESEKVVKDIATRLDLSWDDAVFGSVTDAYRCQYPHLDRTRLHIPDVRFDAPLPDILQSKS